MRDMKLNKYLKELKKDFGNEEVSFAILLTGTDYDEAIQVAPSNNLTPMEWVKLMSSGIMVGFETIILAENLKIIKKTSEKTYNQILDDLEKSKYPNIEMLKQRLGIEKIIV